MAGKIQTLRYLIGAMRPVRWTKNAVILAALMFSRNLENIPLLVRSLAAVALFCLVAGAGYIFNDIMDRAADSRHSMKKSRAIASGMIPEKTAWAAFCVLAVAGIGGSAILDWTFGLCALSYTVLVVFYSLALKKIPIVDILVQSAGLVIRVVAGGVVIHVHISHWLLNCTMLLSLFLTLSKKRFELTVVQECGPGEAPAERSFYSTYLVDQMIAVVTSATLITYALYTISPETVAKFKTDGLILTVPFVLYGILRYLYLIHQKKCYRSPEKEMLMDAPFVINLALYAITAALVVYLA